jgi:hypothetical protein
MLIQQKNKILFYISLTLLISWLIVIKLFHNNFTNLAQFEYLTFYGLYFFTTIFLYSLCRMLKLARSVSGVISFAFLLRLAYLSYTPFDERAHDIASHLEYIHFFSSTLSIPGPQLNAAAIHPPLYYICVSIFYKFFNLLGVFHNQILQFFSILLNIGFVIVSTLIFKTIKFTKQFLVIATSLVAFWPGNIINSVVIGNDNFVAFFFSLSLFFLLKWNRTKNTQTLILFTLTSCLSSSSKLIGVVPALCALPLIYKEIILVLTSKENLFAKKTQKVLLYTFSAMIPLVLGILFSQLYMRNLLEFGYYGGVLKHTELLVQNTLQHFLIFDFKTFILEPFMDSLGDYSGRQFVWNYLWKTSLFGEHSFSGGFLTLLIAKSFSILLIIIGLYSIIGLFLKNKQHNEVHWIFVINFILLLLSIALGRYYLPVSSIADFRYILPILIPISYFFTTSLVKCKNTNIFFGEYLAYMVVGMFCLGSIIFFLAPIFYTN